MEIQDVGVLSLEASGSLFIFVLAIKLYKMKIHTRSGCCGDKFEIETDNTGANSTPMDRVLNQV